MKRFLKTIKSQLSRLQLSQVMVLTEYFKEKEKAPKVRILKAMNIDRNKCLVFFYAASQGEDIICGMGVSLIFLKITVLYLKSTVIEDRIIKLSAWL